MAAEKISITVESETSEFKVELPETSRVNTLLDIVKKFWGGDAYITLHYGSDQMESDKLLSDYNVKDGSIVQVKYFADSP